MNTTLHPSGHLFMVDCDHCGRRYLVDHGTPWWIPKDKPVKCWFCDSVITCCDLDGIVVMRTQEEQ